MTDEKDKLNNNDEELADIEKEADAEGMKSDEDATANIADGEEAEQEHEDTMIAEEDNTAQDAVEVEEGDLVEDAEATRGYPGGVEDEDFGLEQESTDDNRKKSYIIVGVVALLVVALGVSAFMGVFDGQLFTGEESGMEEEEGMPGEDGMPDMGMDMDPESGEVVATVNDEEIYEGELEMMVQQMMMQQGMDPQDEQMAGMEEQMKQDVLDELIMSNLLAQKVQEKGIGLSEEEVDEEYQQMVEMSGGEEAFEEQLAMMGETPEGIKEEIASYSAPQLYFEHHFREKAEERGIEPTEEELEEEYESIVEMSGGEGEVEQQLQMDGQSMEDFRENVETQIIGLMYIKDYMGDMEITEEELQSLYQQQYMGQEDVEFEDVKDDLEMMIYFQEYQEQHLDKLKEEADINIMR